MYTRLVPNFMGFTAIGLLVVAMVGVGVAEEAGLINALIRKLVAVSPGWAMTYILAFVGILSSIAADAGYVVLIPLAGAAFLSLRPQPTGRTGARLRRRGRSVSTSICSSSRSMQYSPRSPTMPFTWSILRNRSA